MSTNVYLAMELEKGGKILGSSKDKGHVNAVEVVSWSHGFSQPTTAATKSSDQQATSRANHSDLSFTKFFDNASSAILKACWTGAQLKTAVFQMYRASGATEVGTGATDYLTISLEDIIISHYSISGGGDELPIENITLNYTKCQYTFKGVVKEDSSVKAQEPIIHDLATNEVK